MEEFHKYIYFYTLDHNGEYTTQSYTLPITPLTFIPVFDDGLTRKYSKQNILWDFGDGTTSQEVTAVHQFKLPGWYNIKCYVLGTEGKGYSDAFSQNVLIKDFITDTLVLSGLEYKIESGLRYPFKIFRFNSWQAYDALSSVGYTINLNVSGNIAPILDAEKYKSDKWGHLKPYSKFETNLYNPVTDKDEILPVNSVVTDKTTDKELYVKISNKKLVFCDKTDTGSCFAGTSGSKLMYYTDDVPQKDIFGNSITQSTIFVSFDRTKFEDHDTIYNKFPENKYAVLNSIFDFNLPSTLIEQLFPFQTVISSNGIDDDNNGNRINTFDIYPQKFTGQKIPFVIRLKEMSGLPSKYNPLLTLTPNSPITKFGDIYIELRDSFNNRITEGITISANFGVLSSEQYGGYFKGYLISDKELKNVHLHAESRPILVERYLVNTRYNIIPQPQADIIHNVIVTKENKTRTLTDDLVSVPGLTGIYSVCVTCQRTKEGPTSWKVWLVDADREKILKVNPDIIENGNMRIIYDNFVLPENSSPSNIASDENGNVWVTLYDSISTIRINESTNQVDRTIVPSIANSIINDENTVTPACVDTDFNNNVWVSYSNQLSSFIEKYDSNGNFIANIKLLPNYQPTEILTDLNANVWGILKDNTTNNKALSSKTDKIFKINSNNNTVTYYEGNGSLWNLTIDVINNIWATKNIKEVITYNTTLSTLSTFKLNSLTVESDEYYISDLEGITCTTDNTILVIDNKNGLMHYFDASVAQLGFQSNSVTLKSVNFNPNRIQDKLNGYGDWNGFKYINKFQHVYPNKQINLYGNSNTFSIYNSAVGQYDVRKINENFDPIAQLNTYKFQDYLLDKGDSAFEMIGTFIGTLTSNPNELGKLIYEKISNFTDNIANIDTCNVKSLQGMYALLDEDFYTFGNSTIQYPAELNRLVDLFSINFSKLKGSRNKFNQNFDSKGFDTESILDNGGKLIYGVNKGKELNFFTTILTAGKDIVAYEKFSEKYVLINTDLSASTSYLQYIDPINRTYALSSYHPYWGWRLSIPDEYVAEFVPRYYSFYEYISGYDNIQTEGIINWSDINTTIPEDVKNVSEWTEIRKNIIGYALAKGLGVIK